MNATASLRWDKPGPGPWVHDAAHSTGPVTPLIQAIFPTAMADGFRSFTARYGMPISHIDMCYVNAFPYGSVRVAGVAPSDRPPPPAWLLRALTRVHPELRRRNRQALVALDRRLWHDDLRRWFDELRPARVDALRALQSVDPVELGNDELASHVEACVAQLADGLREHFSLIGPSSVPIGLHIVRETSRGRTARDAIADLGGAAAGSTGATLPALRAVARAMADARIEATTLDDVRAAPVAAAALDAYLEEYGQRIIGALDVTGRRLVERPEVILRSIAASANDRTHDAADAREHAGGAASDDAAAARRDDRVVDDARLALSSRDDHAGVSCMWPLGLTRRALLAAGARLHSSGLLDEPAHALDCTSAEVSAMLLGTLGAPDGAQVQARVAHRLRLASAEPPPVLGERHDPPDPATFPRGLRTMATAMNAFLGTAESRAGTAGTSGGADHEGERVAATRTGTGIGVATYRGRAVVALDPEDALDRLEPGDVLVTTTTTPAFNCVLPVAGALVTVHGGLMSHAGIAARELGIPAVIGLADALVRIPDGAEIDVDPITGRVQPVTPP